VNDFPKNLEFFTAELREDLPKGMKDDCNWPSERELTSQVVKGGTGVLRARRESIKWIRRVLKPTFVPKDIETRLIALNRDEGYDQTRIRYMVRDYAVQIKQLTNCVTILVRQIGKAPVEETSERLALVRDTVRALLNKDEKVNKISSCKGYANRDGVLKGGPTWSDRSDIEDEDRGIYWWGHVHWRTDGQTVYFSIPKVDGGPVEPTQRKNWF
jgi:hypothetical protein